VLLIVVRVEALLIVELPIQRTGKSDISELCGPVRAVLFKLPPRDNGAKFDDLHRIFYQIFRGIHFDSQTLFTLVLIDAIFPL